MTLNYRPITLLALLLLACGPQEDMSSGATEATGTSTSEPTSTGTSTEPSTTDPTGGAAVGCERRDGDGDVAWYLRCGGRPGSHLASERCAGTVRDRRRAQLAASSL